MALLGIQIGGTKMGMAIFDEKGKIIFRENFLWSHFKYVNRHIITVNSKEFLDNKEFGEVSGVGICVPGICRIKIGTVWPPNIPGREILWDEKTHLPRRRNRHSP